MMKYNVLLTAVLCLFLVLCIPVSADTVMENPSIYSFAEVVQRLPELWTSNPDTVMELMEDYPDYICWRRYDIIGCQSANNRYSAEIHVNFLFSSQEDSAELIRTNFTMLIDSQDDVQKLMSMFWLPDMKAARISGASFPDDEVTLYFSTDETMMSWATSFTKEGKPWSVMVDMMLVRG